MLPAREAKLSPQIGAVMASESKGYEDTGKALLFYFNR